MSIKSELNKAVTHFKDTKKAIIGRGGTLSPNAGFKDLPAAIWNIPINDSLTFLEVEEVSYSQVVPSDVEKNAIVKSLGGMSYRLGNNNMCAEDGEYTLNEADNFSISLGVLEKGTYYFSFVNSLSGIGECVIQTDNRGYSFSSSPFEFTVDEAVECSFDVISENTMYQNGIKLNGTIKNFMLCKAEDEDKEYKPYQPPILVSAKPTSIESRGAQLFDITCPTSKPSGTAIQNTTKRKFTPNTCVIGITHNNYYTPSKIEIYDRTENSFSMITNNYGAGYGIAFAFKLLPNTEYRLNYTSGSKANCFCSFYDDDGNWLSSLQIFTSKSFTTDNYGNVLIIFTTKQDNEEVTVTDVMLNRGAEVAPLKPFSAEPIDTLEIPEAVQSLEGWGLGIDAEYNNHIERRNGRVIYRQMVSKKIFKGTESFWLNGHLSSNYGLNAYQTAWISKGAVKPLCSHFEGKNWGADMTTSRNTVWNVSGANLVFITDGVQTLDEFRAYLAEQYTKGTPVTLVYALAEPIETDITHLFTDTSLLLKVEGSGSITFHNEHKLAVPSKIKYTVKVGI